MKIIVQNNETINVTNLPEIVSGNYWISDINHKNLVNVIAYEGNWILKSNSDIKICTDILNENFSENYFVEQEILKINKNYKLIDINTNYIYNLYILPSFEKFENLLILNLDNEILIGSSDECDIIINNNMISDKQLSINVDLENNNNILKNLSYKNKIYINNKLCIEKKLSLCDIIFINGIYIYFFGSLLLISNNNGELKFNNSTIKKIILKENDKVDYTKTVDREISFFDKNEYFQRPPRFKRKIVKKVFNIESPPIKEKDNEIPLIFSLTPMLAMGIMSMTTGLTALQKVLSGESTLSEQFSSLLVCFCMMISIFIFPLAQRIYIKNKKKKREIKRKEKYKKYINDKHSDILKEINYQRSVLFENNLSLDKLKNIIMSKERTLWERQLEHVDFLEFRLGIGSKKADIEIKYKKEEFTMDEDDLKELILNLVEKYEEMSDVPITLNFRTNNKIGVIGDRNIVDNFYDNLMLQVMANHGYDSLRVIILTNNDQKSYWEKYKSLPYLWNDEKSVRYFASNKDDINRITSLLMEEYNYRKDLRSNNKKILFKPYYLVLIDDTSFIKNNIFINEILKSEINLGYSVVISDEKINSIPNECNMFVNVANGTSGIFTNQMTEEGQINFKLDFVNFTLKDCILKISNIPLDVNDSQFILPKKYGFLEMFDVGNVNQLNIINRWKNNNIIKSLETPVGIDEQGELLKLDLHEKAHGPHGLVAGMTGSGKSEWIITYILSMAINYSPEEVQFVLIDYKGGGLALTFDNKETGKRLPHIVGTLTNLDVAEMKRSLASISSELERRQTLFKNAREKLNESSMDIYKYQELYRAGKLEEPLSHLFIVSDEFAELKSQQPEFMDELISTARIGRSLGVHLILATQKPSGVVDNQIWSNSKFRVCLKVQDKNDSMDMLKCPDAALLKDTGRFYLQVGYNEFFALGQSAYANTSYYESDKRINLIDSTVEFVDEIGSVIKKININKVNTQFVHKGEELPNILDYIIETSKQENLKVRPLWLSRIPNLIYVDKLKDKYNFRKENYILNPIVGEYDEPDKQQQNLLTVPLSHEGNFLLYGSSGSGKELFLTTLIYSLITTYTPQEVGIYILDFGSEVLNNFNDCSHIGDIIHSGEDEKIQNLFKYIKTEINLRKKKFSQYSGNYKDFITKANEKMHNIVVIINGFDVFVDLYNKLSESLYELTRECNKLGIYFVISSNSVNAVKTKLLQTFRSFYTLQLNNEFDYRNIFGNTDGLIPSKIYGRGLIKKGRVLEFQTGYAYDKENLYENIKQISKKIYMTYRSKINSIPVLPKTIEFSHINRKNIDLNYIPLGIIKKDLNVASIKLKDELSYLFSFRNFDESSWFINCFLEILDKSNIDTMVFDTKYLYEKNEFQKIKYLNSGYEKYLDSLNDFSDNIYNILQGNNNNKNSIKAVQDKLCIIVGFNRFIDLLDDEYKEKFKNILKNSKETLKIHFIFIDIPSGFKPYEYEPWYKSSIEMSTGLWIGNGFAEQYLIKPTKVLQEYFSLIDNNYGYIVEKGQVNFIKIIEKI